MQSPTGINITITKVIFFLYVLLSIVQDLHLQQSIGTIARSPYIFLSPLVFAFILLRSARFYSYKIVNGYFVYFLYSVIISIVLLIYYLGFKQVENRVYNENLILKLFKASMYNFIIILTLYNFIYILKVSSHRFNLQVLKALIICQLVVGAIQFFWPDLLSFLKTPELNTIDRLSVLNSEPASAFPQVLLSFLLYAVYKMYVKNRFSLFDYVLGILVFILLLLIRSRGGLVISIMCLAFIVLFTKQTIKAKLVTLSWSLLIILPAVYIVVDIVIPSLVVDIEEFSSISTRSITILASLKSLIDYPFGQGYSAYLITFPQILVDTKNYVLNSLPIPLVTNEIDEMLTTGRSLTVKSGLLNEVLYSGWIILLFYVFLFTEGYKKMRAAKYNKLLFLTLRFMFLFIIINYLFVSTIETSYITFLPFALVEKFYEEKYETVSC